ncbi:MAG: DUF928 domain-containing protein [Trichodesmium sp. MO_231.B1]|nr:DUF928 domain-containing protein [Trichodesmium sp. MO_231.B1]
MKYKQVIACALGLLVGITQPVLGEFKIPTTSRPGDRGDGGGRDPKDPNNPPKLCPQMEKPLLALIPQSNLGYTLASHPTFWLYIPGYSKSINFTLIDEATGKEIYQTKFNFEFERGIISLKLPSAAPPLKVGKQYRWRFVFDCGSGADNLPVDGVVERVAATDSLTSRLNSAATVMEKIDIYAALGLWYETITELGNLRRSNPDDVAIKARWNSLLQQDYIRFPDYDLTSERIQDCCNVGDK